MEADDAPARARARRHRPTAVELALYLIARREADTTDPIIRQEIAALESATASAGCSCCARSWAGAEVVLGGDEDVLHRARAASRRLRRARRRAPTPLLWGRLRARVQLLARVHDHGRHLERAAQHHRRAGAGASAGTGLSIRRDAGVGSADGRATRIDRSTAVADVVEMSTGFIVSSATSGTRSASSPTRSSRSSTAAIV